MAALKLAEIIVKPAPEPLPKLKFRLPLLSASISGQDLASMVPTGAQPQSRRSSEVGARPPPLMREESPDVPLIKSIIVRQPQPHKRASNKVKQPKQLDAQRSGMPIEDVRGCESVLGKLVNTRLADLFRHPVDPVKDNVPECVRAVIERG